MSQTVFRDTNSAFVKQLLALDDEISAKIKDDAKSVNEVYQMYLERLSLLEKSCILPLSEEDKELLQNIKDDVYLELKLYKLKANVKKQIDDIHDGLNDLENKF